MTQIVMPYMTQGIARYVPDFQAWRWAFFLPGCLFIIITCAILLLGQVRGLLSRAAPACLPSLLSHLAATVHALTWLGASSGCGRCASTLPSPPCMPCHPLIRPPEPLLPMLLCNCGLRPHRSQSPPL